MHALIVAGNGEDIARRMAQVLQRVGQVDVQVAHNTEEALELLSARRWDAVLWKIAGTVLPGIPGLREILARQRGVAVVVLTEIEDVPMAVRAIEAGASCYLLLGPHAEVALEPLLANALATASLHSAMERVEERSALLSARLRLIGELTRDAVFVVSPAGSILWANASAERLLNRPASDLLGTNAGDLFRPGNLLQRILDVLAGCAATEELADQGSAVILSGERPSVVGVEAFLRQTSGSFLLVHLSAAALDNGDGGFSEAVVVASPVSQDQFLLAELALCHRRLDVFLDLASQAVAFTDPRGIVAKVNQEFANLAGASDPAECVGHPAGKLLDEPSAIGDLLDECLVTGEPRTAAVQLRRADGSRVRARLRAAVVRDQDERSIGALLVVEEAPQEAVPQALRRPTEARLLLRALEAAKAAQDWQDAQQVLELLMDLSANAVTCDAGALVVLRGRQEIPLIVRHGVSAELAQQLARLAAGKLSEQGTIMGPKPTIVPSLEAYLSETADKNLVKALLTEGLQSCALIPLTAGPLALGLMFWGASRSGALDQTRSEELALVAAEASSVVAVLLSQIELVRAKNSFSQVAELSLDLLRAQDVEEILSVSAVAAVRLLEADWVAAHVLDARREELEQAVQADADGNVTSRTTMPTAAHDAAWQAMERDRPLVRSIDADGQSMTLATAALRAEGETVGALIVAWHEQRQVSEEELNLVDLLGRMTGMAAMQAQVFEKETSRSSQVCAVATEALELEARARNLLQVATTVQELTELDDILASLAEAGLRIVGLEHVALYLADHEKGQLTGAVVATEPQTVRPLVEEWPLQKGSSVYADAALSDSPYLVAVIESVSGAYEAALIPLRTQSALVGLLVGANPSSGREISPQDLKLLRSLGGLASVAINRARVNEMRDMMARSVSHELRAPLASTRAYVEVVLDEGVGPINQEQRVFLQRAANACDYLQRLVEDLLDLSRLRSGEISLNPTITDLVELIEHIVDSLRLRAEQNNIELDVNVAPEVAELLVDRTRLAQILTNLIDNAVKFNYHGGRVSVRATLEGREVLIAVSDTGPGIAEAEQEAIFDEFYRGKGELTQARTGAGLGLAIAKRVATFLGGTLTVQSELGQGSTFFLRFPYQPPDVSETSQKDTEVTDFGPGKQIKSSDCGR